MKLRLSSEVTAISSVGHDIPEYTIKYLKGGNEFEESYDAVRKLLVIVMLSGLTTILGCDCHTLRVYFHFI